METGSFKDVAKGLVLGRELALELAPERSRPAYGGQHFAACFQFNERNT